MIGIHHLMFARVYQDAVAWAEGVAPDLVGPAAQLKIRTKAVFVAQRFVTQPATTDTNVPGGSGRTSLFEDIW